MSALTIVMYHYVRPISKSEFKGIKGLEIEGFERQLDYLEENFCIVNTEQVIDAVVKKKKLPSRACWLTFDDGYKDHIDYVLPQLLKRDLSGAFFPPKKAIVENIILDVNSIHHILSCASDIKILVNKLKQLCLSNGIKIERLNSYEKEFAVADRFDDSHTVFVKQMLQHVLPEDVRNSITSDLFKEYVGISETEFSRKLYMNIDDIRKLVKNDMYVGSHGAMHYWLNRISADKQKEDIIKSLEFLEDVGTSTKNWIMCYPYGAYNEITLSLLKEFNAAIGITTEIRRAELFHDNPLTLPRFDTNDFPQ